MNEKYIELLQKQIQKLDSEDFDLEAWKSATIILLARIFGDSGSKIKEIDKIKFDLSSWAMRDASGSYDQIKSCKKRGKGILEACIDEIEVLGIDEDNDDSKDVDDALIECIELELKIAQYKELMKILKTKSSPEEKKKIIINKLQTYGVDVSPNIVANILTNNSLKKKFK